MMSHISEHKLARVSQVIRQDYDFIRFTWADIHGISRSRIVQSELAVDYMKNGVGVVSLANIFGTRSAIPAIKEVTDIHYGNSSLECNLDTLHDLPWLGKGKHRVGEILCDVKWLADGSIQEAATRNMAVKQICRLNHEFGFRFLSSAEVEFRVYNKDGEPVFDGPDMFCNAVYGDHLEHQMDIVKNLSKAGVSVACLQCEYGSGQFEFTIEPDFGISAMDQYFILKDSVREMYRQRGFAANFQTFNVSGETSNGLHMNHSLWSADGEHNVLYDAKSSNGLSAVGEHWLAGLIAHAPALTALMCPTISCYRRLHNPWAPDFANWRLDDRFATFRTKSRGERGTYIENRMPTGSCNYYIAAAATIAAGLDGITKKMPLPPAADPKAVRLPETLGEALKALEEDKAICEALGKEFVRWFTIAKRTLEIEKIGDFDKNTAKDEEKLKKEYDLYKLC